MTAPEMTPAQVAARIAEIIRTRPDVWDQGIWLELGEGSTRRVGSVRDDLCGTVACVAGWAAILTAPEDARAMAPAYGLIRRLILPDNSVREIKEAGRAALGLDESDAYWLFDGARTRDQALTALDDITAGRPVTQTADDDEYDEGGE